MMQTATEFSITDINFAVHIDAGQQLCDEHNSKTPKQTLKRGLNSASQHIYRKQTLPNGTDCKVCGHNMALYCKDVRIYIYSDSINSRASTQPMQLIFTAPNQV